MNTEVLIYYDYQSQYLGLQCKEFNIYGNKHYIYVNEDKKKDMVQMRIALRNSFKKTKKHNRGVRRRGYNHTLKLQAK